MSECSGKDCTHSSHDKEDLPLEETKRPTRNPIITPNDVERWPLLEMISQPCSLPITPADEQAIMEMDTILDVLGDDAAGLAAVQIGVPRRIFLLRNKTNAEGDVENNVYINPTVLWQEGSSRGGEACLSLPGMSASFPRPKTVMLKFFDLSGEVCQEKFTGFWARAVMHEMDHLNGILITEHLQEQIAKQPRRTSFGMKITPQKIAATARRRAKNKRARKARKVSRANGR